MDLRKHREARRENLFSSSSLPQVEIEILDATEVCESKLTLLTDAAEPTMVYSVSPIAGTVSERAVACLIEADFFSARYCGSQSPSARPARGTDWSLLRAN